VLARVRIWLPDAPGVLGAVAAEIGDVRGNVVSLEVLERDAGVAIDELVIELPDEVGAVDALCRRVRNVPGAGVEEVVELELTEPGAGAPDREDSVLLAATAMLAETTPEAVLKALSDSLVSLFDLSWFALMDDVLRRFVEQRGDLPSVEWVLAFAHGARSGADPADDTKGSGVFTERMSGWDVMVCGGRVSPIRRRERHEITMLVMVAVRYVEALTGATVEASGESAPSAEN
jgi:hypothetical protein